MNAYFIKCNEVIYHKDGTIKEILATYDEETKSGTNFTARKPNGTIHYLEATKAIPATFKEFGHLLDDNEESSDYLARFNQNSLITYQGYVENYLKDVKPEDKFQFVRDGYYSTDFDSTKDNLIFNQTVALKSSYK